LIKIFEEFVLNLSFVLMTAVICILNKTGVAVAADSAVTVSAINQKKIYNTAKETLF
jgi:20S proteasome alpha/beta subunit